MTAQALYNRWRGQTFADVLGQEHITTTLQNQIRAGRIGHAYLFTGLRGTGKTSTARIMAKAVNCVGQTDTPPCNQCPICRSLTAGRSLDLIEIDAASNRGIDEIRDLRERVNFSPSECRYKVYVIDEVHMLTNEAFNALLKTLEEPPPHVIFILCTTEPHRLPDTVLSRCQRFDFRRGSVAVLLQKLARICAEEQIAIAPEALDFVARRATGSFRDAESLLDQLSAYGAHEISLDQVQRVLGAVPYALVAQVAWGLLRGQVAEGLRAISTALDSGAEPQQFLSEILDYLRTVMLAKIGSSDDLITLSDEALSDLRRELERETVPLPTVVRAIRLFNDAGVGLRTAARPHIPLELALVEATLAAPATSEAAPVAARPPVAERPVAPTKAPPTVDTVAAPIAPPAAATGQAAPPPARQSVQSAAPPAEPPAPAATPATASAGPLTLEWVKGNWRQMLVRIRPLSPQVQALLNSTEPLEVRGDTITLGCPFAFHRDRLSEDRNRDLVEQVLAQVLGQPCHVQCTVQSAPKDAGPATTRQGPQAQTQARMPTPPQGPPSAQAAEPRPRGEAASDTPSPSADSRDEVRQSLINHPAVQELVKQGGRVAKVDLTQEDQEDRHGQ
jgi:DNA polymerase-3 subunit gamma/tau